MLFTFHFYRFIHSCPQKIMSSVSLDSRSHVKIAHSFLGKRSYVYYWSSLMNRTGQPTIHTYWEILKGIVSTIFLIAHICFREVLSSS